MTTLLTERYKNDLLSVLSCYDRIVIMGTLPGVCYARGMTGYLYAHQIKVFNYASNSERSRYLQINYLMRIKI